jgi:uncharacterized membrane protein
MGGSAALIAAHASAATVALLLGPVNLIRKPKGDRLHRRIGGIWVVAMYWTVLSSFAIKRLRPGHFSWIHGLSIFTFITLSIGLWAAMTGRVHLHQRFITGSYFGLLGAFVGAVVVPVRAVPQLAAHHPIVFAAAALGCVAAAAVLVLVSARGERLFEQRADARPGSGQPAWMRSRAACLCRWSRSAVLRVRAAARV